MPYEMETYSPYSAARQVTIEEIPALFRPDGEPVFAYGNGSDEDVLIVSVHDGFSTVSLRQDDTWYWLAESENWDEVEIVLAGLEAWVPAGACVRHETALEALRLAADVPRLTTEFTWREQ
ncbi:MAG: hypothetical protein HOV66_10915 [Streptomycetaceae bacterium]|nr:hypothetical protein [Streptomycetaceae bacterium]